MQIIKGKCLRLKGEEISLRPTATVRLDFLTSGDSEEEEDFEGKNISQLGSYFPDKYASEPRLRIEAYRKLAYERNS